MKYVGLSFPMRSQEVIQLLHFHFADLLRYIAAIGRDFANICLSSTLPQLACMLTSC